MAKADAATVNTDLFLHQAHTLLLMMCANTPVEILAHMLKVS